MTPSRNLSDALRFASLFSVLYFAFGVASPFLPAFLSSRGLAPEQVGVALSLGTAVRLLSGPAAGRIADGLHALRVVLAVCAGTAGAMALGIVPAHGFLPLLAATLLQAARSLRPLGW
jgi:PPP family 3-phenylpropionic acid transporter